MNSSQKPFRPDPKGAGIAGKPSDDAVWTWFSPPDFPQSRMRYAVIEEEDGLLQIQPGEGRFKKGLPAWRFASEDAADHTVWKVVKTRPNRIDLRAAKG